LLAGVLRRMLFVGFLLLRRVLFGGLLHSVLLGALLFVFRGLV
jgi:hypothetical protein